MKLTITINNLTEHRFNFAWKKANEVLYEDHGLVMEPADHIELDADDFSGDDLRDLANVVGDALIAACTATVKKAREKRRDELKNKVDELTK